MARMDGLDEMAYPPLLQLSRLPAYLVSPVRKTGPSRQKPVQPACQRPTTGDSLPLLQEHGPVVDSATAPLLAKRCAKKEK